jgi:hypothetical protein
MITTARGRTGVRKAAALRGTLAVLLLGSVYSWGVAGPAEGRQAAAPDRDVHCATTAAPLSGTARHQRLTRCSTTSPAHARRLLDRSMERTNGRVSAQGGTLLMRFWEHQNYEGGSNSVIGYAGPCDATGYSIYTNTVWYQWGDVVSSIWGYNGCNTARLVHQNGVTAGTYRLPMWNLGYYNDNVQFIKVYRR